MPDPHRTRVVVTGAGIVSSIGATVEEFWQAALEGTSRVEPIPQQWPIYHQSHSRYWAPLPAPDYGRYGLRRADFIKYDPVVLNTIVAADQALHAAGAMPGTPGSGVVDPARAGILIGTTLGGVCSPMNNHYPHLLAGLRDQIERLAESGHALAVELAEALRAYPRVSPLVAPQAMPNAIPAALAIRYGMQGPCQAIGTACASGTTAIGGALQAIRAGRLDLALAGGAEHMGDRAGAYFMGFDRLATLAAADLPPQAINRPFDRRRSGFLYSEGGAAVLVLESLAHASARGAAPLAELCGYGETCDALSMVAMREDNALTSLAVRQALHDAGIEPAAIDYVNAHGTGTATNDDTESALLEALFGDRPVVNSTKSLLGHTIGACGAIEALVCALTLRDGIAHPSLNLDEPVRALNFARTARRGDYRCALSTNYGFGGHNAALVFKRCE